MGIVVAAGVAILALLAWFWFGDRLAPGEPASTLEEAAHKLEITFEDLRDQGVAVDGPVAWNYMFVNRDYGVLSRFIQAMKSEGFDVAEVTEVEDDDAGTDYELRLRKVESHTPATLAQRIEDMRSLAQRWNVDLFDGWFPEGYEERAEVSH